MNDMFGLIRDYSKFCAVCGKKLDLKWISRNGTYEWHYPFCRKCREVIWELELHK